MKGWETKKLGEVCDLIARGVAPKYLETGGARVVNQKCVRDHAINFDLARRHDHTAKAVPKDRYIRAGDVLVNSTGTGTLGRVAQVRQEPDEPTTVDTHVTIVRPQAKRFYPDFFGYMLIKIEDEIAASGEGASGQTELARSTLTEKFLVSFPTSLDEQRRIVAILDEAFAGLAVMRQHAEANLKNARALFDSHLNAIFSERGEGWLERRFGEICENLDSRRVPITKRDRNEGSIPYYGASGIVDYVEEYIFDENILLVSEDGANLIARTYPIAFSVSGKCWVNNHAHVVRFDEIATQKFVELYLNSISLEPFVSGMAQPKLNQKALNSIPIPLPDLRTQEKLVAAAYELISGVERLESLYRQKLAAIDELKQSILHRAFSGQLTGEAIAA